MLREGNFRALVALAAAAWLAFAPPLPSGAAERETNGVVVLETDFGLKDGAVSAMRGVAVSVDKTLRLEDLTHEIPPFDIWEGADRLARPRPTGPGARFSSRSSIRASAPRADRSC